MSKLINIKSRFAPAPTGSLHLGSAHTAFFVWLFSKHNKGKFILRLEDSDISNTSDEAKFTIIEELKWLGLVGDNERGVLQSNRIKNGIYDKMLDILWQKNLVKEVDDGSGRGKVITYFPPEKKIIVKDILRGEVVIKYSNSSDSQLSPFIIIRSDKTPVYNFACVVDDILMEITHVIRGDDILSNTAKQISLYNALEHPIPIFAHLSRILDVDGKPLSKRRGSKSISQFKQEGYLSEAILNYLALLGWSSPSGDEILSIKQIINEFTLERVRISPIRFDPVKLDYINAKYIRNLNIESLFIKFNDYLEENNLKIDASKKWVNDFCKIYAPRCNNFRDLYKNSVIYTQDTVVYDKDLFLNYVIYPEVIPIINNFISLLENYSTFNDLFIDDLRSISKKCNVTFKQTAQCIRVILLNSNHTPDLLAVLSLLDKIKIENRMQTCKKMLQSVNWPLVQSISNILLQYQSLYNNTESIIKNNKIPKSVSVQRITLETQCFLKNKLDELIKIKNSLVDF